MTRGIHAAIIALAMMTVGLTTGLASDATDVDGDGYTAAEEIMAGSDVNNPRSTPINVDGDALPDAADPAPRTFGSASITITSPSSPAYLSGAGAASLTLTHDLAYSAPSPKPLGIQYWMNATGAAGAVPVATRSITTSMLSDSWTVPFDTAAFAEGAYTFTVDARFASSLSWSTVSASFPVVVDRTAPTSSLTTLPEFFRSSSLSVGWTRSDATSPVTCTTVYVSGPDAPSDLGCIAGTSVPFQPTAEGLFTFTTRAVDAAGNVEAAAGASTATATYDITPAVLAVAPMPARGYAVGDALRVSFTASEPAGTPAPTAKLGSRTIPFNATASSGNTFVFDTAIVPGDGNGFRAVTFTHKDRAGNTATDGSLNVLVDQVAPVLTLSLSPSSGRVGTVIEATVTADEALRAPPSVTLGGRAFVVDATRTADDFTTTVLTLTIQEADEEGSHVVSASGADLVGNPKTATRALTLDFTPPSTTAAIEGNPGPHSRAQALSIVVARGPDADSVKLERSTNGEPWALEAILTTDSYLFVPADGHTYAFRTIGTDRVGNVETDVPEEGDVSILIDHTAPVAAIGDLPGRIPTRSFPVTWASSDATSGVAHVELWYRSHGHPARPFSTVSGATDAEPFTTGGTTFAHPVDGWIDLWVIAEDRAGNRQVLDAAAPHARVLIDTDPNADEDDDGYPDGDEWAKGSDPHDHYSTPQDVDGDGIPDVIEQFIDITVTGFSYVRDAHPLGEDETVSAVNHHGDTGYHRRVPDAASWSEIRVHNAVVYAGFPVVAPHPDNGKVLLVLARDPDGNVQVTVGDVTNPLDPRHDLLTGPGTVAPASPVSMEGGIILIRISEGVTYRIDPLAPDGDFDGDGYSLQEELIRNSDPFWAQSTPASDDDGDGMLNEQEQSRVHAIFPEL